MSVLAKEPNDKAMLSNFSELASRTSDILEENESTIMCFVNKMLDDREQKDVITLADFGTADGGNVLPIMIRLIQTIQRKKSAKQHINVVFEDIYHNDFKSLIHNIQGKNGKLGLQNGNVHPLISPTSMYEQCLPDESLDFGLSSFAVHWLSDWHVKIKSGIFAVDAGPEQFSVLKNQASMDWRHFVFNRGKELKRGGLFFVTTLVTGDSQVYDIITKVYKEMVTDGIISEGEFENTHVESFIERTEDDLKIPFRKDQDDEISQLGLKIVYFKLHTRETYPFQSNNDTSDETEKDRAERLAFVIKGWLYSSLYSGLSDDRSPRERNGVLDVYFEKLRRQIYLEGSKFQYINPMADIVFQKQ